MEMQGLGSLPPIAPLGADKPAAKPGVEGFGEMLNSMIKNVESANKDADSAVQGMLSGESTDIHSVMLAVNKADLSLRLALEVRNKLMDAYQEIMRMTV